MIDLLLVLNAGSSSLKAKLFEVAPDWPVLESVVVDGIGAEQASLRSRGSAHEPRGRIADHADAATLVLETLAPQISGGELLATAHRIVHGGELFTEPTIVDDRTRAGLATLASLAPLHNPPALAVLDTVVSRYGDVPAIAVFDTAFFRDLPEHARTYAVPSAWRALGIRRYGFHGIAHEDIYRRYAADSARKRPPGRVVTLQLGNGCSAAAILDGRPVDTSMGMTPLEGLVMGTRCGDLDPGVILHLAREGLTWTELDAALHRSAGLKALTERTGDMREVVALAAGGEPRAALALRVFCYRVQKYIGAYAAALGGLDALVLGGGIGENSPQVRARICAGLEWLGVELDASANEHWKPPVGQIAAPGARADVYVVAVDEERAIVDYVSAKLGLA